MATPHLENLVKTLCLMIRHSGFSSSRFKGNSCGPQSEEKESGERVAAAPNSAAEVPDISVDESSISSPNSVRTGLPTKRENPHSSATPASRRTSDNKKSGLVVNGGRIRLPDKLMEYLNNEVVPEALYWVPEGNGESFALNTEKAQKQLLDPYFGGTKISSFMRSLSRWGFKRVFFHTLDKMTYAFHHELFNQKAPHLEKEMKMIPVPPRLRQVKRMNQKTKIKDPTIPSFEGPRVDLTSNCVAALPQTSAQGLSGVNQLAMGLEQPSAQGLFGVHQLAMRFSAQYNRQNLATGQSGSLLIPNSQICPSHSLIQSAVPGISPLVLGFNVSPIQASIFPEASSTAVLRSLQQLLGVGLQQLQQQHQQQQLSQHQEALIRLLNATLGHSS